jgi:hypothetical protein
MPRRWMTVNGVVVAKKNVASSAFKLAASLQIACLARLVVKKWVLRLLIESKRGLARALRLLH